MTELQTFKGISLTDMEAVKLLNRIDSKYIFHESELPAILKEIEPYYNILEINRNRQHRYESLYFDTPDYQLYYQHHNGKPNRMKVRFRRYTDTGLTFFEVKNKTGNSRTIKYREERSCVNDTLQATDYMLCKRLAIAPEQLQHQLWIYFDRITLVSKDFSERLTFDLNLAFRKAGSSSAYQKLVIAEVKQDKNSVISPIVQSLRCRYISSSNFSKYSVGIATLGNVKSNSFKPLLLKLNKILKP